MTAQDVNLLCSAVWCWKVLLLPGDPSAFPSHLTPDRMMAGSHALFCRQGGLPFLEWRAVEGEMLKTLCHSYGPPSAPVPCVKQKNCFFFSDTYARRHHKQKQASKECPSGETNAKKHSPPAVIERHKTPNEAINIDKH